MLEATKHPHFYDIGKPMLHAWSDGMNSLQLKKIWSLHLLDSAIEQARFSDPLPVKPAPREVLGRSPLLARR